MISTATPIEEYEIVLQKLKTGFNSHLTREYSFRKEQLHKLYKAIKYFEGEIQNALYEDLRKSPSEAYLTEIGPQLAEIRHTLKHLKSWMKGKRVGTPALLLPSKSFIQPEPKGMVVIFAPWNYPFGLVIGPLIAAIAAGNTVLLKPAHETPHVAEVIKQLVQSTFNPKYVNVILGEGAYVGDYLLENFEFDHIFFTGSLAVGKHIMSKAARTLTPVSLELGGKSPAIIHPTADLRHTIKRVVWAKYLNCGQTCIAPDYVLVHESRYDNFVKGTVSRIKEVYNDNPVKSAYYNRIVNQVRFDHLISMLNGADIIYGGRYNREDLYVEPTLVKVKNVDTPLMRQEIFGPILPIMIYKNETDLWEIINRNSHPLAMYIFSNDQGFENRVMSNVLSGAVCVNDCAVHYGNPNLPFGGIKYSGLGSYHGKFGFDTFSHLRAVLKSSPFMDLAIKYPPYEGNMGIIKRMFEGWF